MGQYVAVYCVTILVSVAFPDPHGSASFWEAGARVISRSRICIRFKAGYVSASKSKFSTNMEPWVPSQWKLTMFRVAVDGLYVSYCVPGGGE
jgi:hypothetical protein